MKLTFLGATRTVTGSKHLVDTGTHRVLIDCGLFQGLKELRQRNWAPLPVDPSSIHAVVLTHAHIDHTGYLPRLAAQGFQGRVFCTPGTADLCRIMLPDAGRLAEEDAREANRQRYTRHDPALPLFTEEEAVRALALLQPVGYERCMPVAPGVEAEFIPAGHLLGSAFVRLRCGDGPTLLFSGDLGRYNRPVLPDPTDIASADVLVLESTYGDRLHEPDDGGRELADVINTTVERGGKVVIPAFAVGRAEEVIYWLKKLEDERRIPVLPVYLDSPMALEALKDYAGRTDELDPEMRTARGEMSAFSTRRFRAVASAQQSCDLVASHMPAIIISSSGMATGGRVLNHLEAVLPSPKHTVLFVGFQAEATRGRKLIEGAPEIKIHGNMVRVAARIAHIDSMSAHADSGEILRWLGGFVHPPAMTYLVHGEPPALDALKAAIEQRPGWRVEVAEYLAAREL